MQRGHCGRFERSEPSRWRGICFSLGMATQVQDSGHGAPIRLFFTDHWKGVLVALVLAFAVALAATRLVGDGAETRAVERMPDAQRRALYEQSFRSTQSLCAQAETDVALADRCVGAAQFLLAFPECDDGCRAFAGAHRQGPTR